MSVLRGIIEILCDGPSEGVECASNGAWTDSGPASELRKRMREDGWTTGLPGGIDRCPACTKQAASATGSSATDQPGTAPKPLEVDHA